MDRTASPAPACRGPAGGRDETNADARRESRRAAPLALSSQEFRRIGHQLVDRVAEFLDSLPDRPVTTGEPPSAIRALLGDDPLPEEGADAGRLLEEISETLFEHSLLNGHPRFLGYITASPAPIGALADMLAAAVNPNVGAWNLAPVASEVERQTVRWIAAMIGYPRDCGGLLVSGGNQANFVGFLAARHAMAGWNVREDGMAAETGQRLRVYASDQTHTWLQKATDMFGLGTGSVRTIPTDAEQRMDVAALLRRIEEDTTAGERPFLVIASAGSVGTGAIDPLRDISRVCREHRLWLHVDGAYGAFAAAIPEQAGRFAGLELADSIALDPHKWLYAPLEAGCALVRDAERLRGAFYYQPEYYKFQTVRGERTHNFSEFGPQNSRGFRALKVWLALRQAGRSGYVRMISDDIRLAERLFDLARAHPELEAVTHNLSVVTFRYRPAGFRAEGKEGESYLNELNERILTTLQEGGEAFVSNAVVRGTYLLRACVVNFRTSRADIEAIPEIVVRLGREADRALRG